MPKSKPSPATSISAPASAPTCIRDLSPELVASLAALGVTPDTVIVSAIVDAASDGRPEVIKLLAPVSNISIYGHLAMRLAAHHGHLSCVELFLPVPGAHILEDEVKQFSRGLVSAALNGHLECLNAILPFADPSHDNSAAISFAAEHGHAECVSALLPFFKPADDNFRPLVMAVTNKHPDCVKLLAPLTTRAAFTRAVSVAVGLDCPESVAALLAAGRFGHDKLSIGIEPLGLAALFGYARIIELLIPVCDPKEGNSVALKQAAEGGIAGCVELLIPHSDPLAGKSAALAQAIGSGRVECARLLLPVSNVDDLEIDALERAVTADYPDPLSEAIHAMSDKGRSLPLARFVATAIEEGSAKCLSLLLFGLPFSPFGSKISADRAQADRSTADEPGCFSLRGMMDFLEKAREIRSPIPDIETMLAALVERLVLEESPTPAAALVSKGSRLRAL